MPVLAQMYVATLIGSVGAVGLVVLGVAALDRIEHVRRWSRRRRIASTRAFSVRR
ncbi:hypothetical protein [Microbacterium marinilacus]|uniref:Uncharacterized protein n=1 Tax=Microbacterium marinilacus TaxID=415209 RepID=A0ABP7B708_9MICO|nr:hypothetical protein [Microbacterium marinilacus]MBY0689934.1 hypothetical protein [Microbacterium marinilacus]